MQNFISVVLQHHEISDGDAVLLRMRPKQTFYSCLIYVLLSKRLLCVFHNVQSQ